MMYLIDGGVITKLLSAAVPEMSGMKIESSVNVAIKNRELNFLDCHFPSARLCINQNLFAVLEIGQ